MEKGPRGDDAEVRRRRQNRKALLAYENKLTVHGNEPPGNPVKLKPDEAERIRLKLNAIHGEEVLLISNNIPFETGSAAILPSSYPEMYDIAKLLKEQSSAVRIVGHTDNVGDAFFNQSLSVKRALAIRSHLIGKGTPARRLSIAGYGMSKPIGSNNKAEGRAQNRRVEFIVVE